MSAPPLTGPAGYAPTAPPPPASPASPVRSDRLRRVVLGRDDDPAWVRPSVLALLAATVALYLWGLGASGWANSFYSAAAQAGSTNWKAFFFGSFDGSNAITVDKPPASLWVMALSARIFGLSSWSVLVPQALEGVAAVGVLYATVRRWFTPAAGLLAGAVLALTPAATLMFRFNNPDALLTLVLTVGAYAVVRAVESGHTKWLVLAGSLVGAGFLTKMLQAFLVVPAFALVYLMAGPPQLRRRVRQLLWAAVALVVSSGWWVAVVELIPASARPYIGGSQNNSVLDLIFGYNGFGRLTGDETGSVGGGLGGGFWGATGWGRMFNSEFGGQVSWLLPAALILLTAGLLVTRQAPRHDRTRAALVLWGGWLLVTGLVFSFGQGIIHPYYAVVLAPAIGAIVGIGATLLWSRRSEPGGRALLAGTVAVTAAWAYVLLGRTPDWHPGLRSLVGVAGFGAAALIVTWPRLSGRLAAAVAAAALMAGLTGPAAYAVDTASTPHTGAIPSAGPTVSVGFGRGLGLFGGFRGFGNGNGLRGNGFGGNGFGNGGNGGNGLGNGFGNNGLGGNGNGLGGNGFRGGFGGGAGGLLSGSTPGADLVAALDADAGDYTWVAAVVGANRAAGYQLATDDPVMAIGGFNGTDPSPTLEQFQLYVAEGKIHYFIAGGEFGVGQGTGSSASAQISAWVTSAYSATTVDGVTLYDLSGRST